MPDADSPYACDVTTSENTAPIRGREKSTPEMCQVVGHLKMCLNLHKRCNTNLSENVYFLNGGSAGGGGGNLLFRQIFPENMRLKKMGGGGGCRGGRTPPAPLPP